jgi:hypothetical protein
LYAFTTPVLFYAFHLYPEIPVAFFSLYIYRKLRSQSPPAGSRILLMGIILSFFIWFGLKYNLILFPFLIIGVVLLLKDHKVGWKVLYYVIPPLISLGLFYLYLYHLYGSFSPFSVYEGVMTPEKVQAFKSMIFKIPLMLRIDTLFDYFLDQRDGLLLYSPLYIFMFPGMVEAFRKARKDFVCLLFLSLPFVLNYAFLTHRQGHCPQGRILTPLSWAAVLFIGYFLFHNRKKIFRFLFKWAGLASVAMALFLVFHPSALYQPTTHDVLTRPGEAFIHLSNMNFFLPRFLPSFIKIDNSAYLPNYIWTAGILLFVLFYAFNRRDIRPKPVLKVLLSGTVLSAAFLLWVAYPRPVLYPSRVFHYSPQRALGFYLFPMGKDVVAKNEAEFYLHREKDFRFLFSSRRRLEKIRLVFGSEMGEYSIRISIFDMPAFEGKTTFQKKTLEIPLPPPYLFKRLFLYEIKINLEKHSPESMLRDPYFVQVLPLRERDGS